jgi:L,D-transpeptidase catalytic domain
MATASHRFCITLTCLAASVFFAGTVDARSSRETKWNDVAQGRAAGPPILAVVAIKEQRITIYDADGPILRAPVSSGRTEYETPVGVFSVLQKEAEHYSNRYDDASMPFMERITWSGIALHAGALPGYPASHGCIRLPHEFAERLFGLTKLGMRVVIGREDVAPVRISHPALLSPKLDVSNVYLVPTSDRSAQPTNKATDENHGVPVAVTAQLGRLQSIAQTKKAEADAAAQEADKAKQIAEVRIAEKKQALKEIGAAEQVKTKAEQQVAEAELQTVKSFAALQRAQQGKAKATAKLFHAYSQLNVTRSKLQPPIDAADRVIEAAKVAESARIAAVEAASEAKLKLSPVSIFISLKTQRLYVRQAFEPVFEMPVTIRDPDKLIGTHIFTAVGYDNGGEGVRWNVVSIGGRQPDKADARAAIAALDRITVPQEIIDRFSQSVWVGSSLIISDEDLNKETGPATDFIVVSSADPQGGLKTPKPEPHIERTVRYTDRDRERLYRRAPDEERMVRYTDRDRERLYRRAPNEGLFRHPFGGFFSNW